MGISSLVTRYTSNFKMLPSIIQKIKSNNQIPIIDYANENVKQYEHNYSVICDTIKKYPNTTMSLKFSSLGLSYMYDNEVTKLARDIIELAKENKVKSFTYAASSSTYGDHPDLPKIEK